MQAFIFQSHVREDGGVDVRLPIEYAGMDVELVVVVQPLTAAAPEKATSTRPAEPERKRS